MKYTVVCPRRGTYAHTDTLREAQKVIREELPGGIIRRRNPRPKLPEIEGGEDYYIGAFRGAVLGEDKAPEGSSSEFKRGFKLGKKASPSDTGYAQGIYEATSDMRRAGQQLIERAREEGERVKNPAHEDKWIQKATKGMKKGALTRQARAAGYTDTMEFARAVLTGEYLDKRTGKMRTPTATTRRRAQFAVNMQRRNPGHEGKLTALPPNVTVEINGKKVRRVGDNHVVVNSRRYTMKEATKKVFK